MASHPNVLESSSLPPTPQNPADVEVIMIQELVSPKPGVLPTLKDSIEAMPKVTVTEEGTECSICLEAYHVGAEAREMPCKHRFHSVCIEKWLEIRGSCPICRFLMPTVETEWELSNTFYMPTTTYLDLERFPVPIEEPQDTIN